MGRELIPPVVTVTCTRDLPLLELQAQSIHKYLDRICPVYIIVNEDDTSQWFEYFDKHIKHLYCDHDLTVLSRADFPGPWQVFLPHRINPWGQGWQMQQVLKLAIAERLNHRSYLILDSQNFLIFPWSSCYIGDRIPYRKGFFVMPKEIFYRYAQDLELDTTPDLDKHYMSMCTPFYMHTGMVQRLIDHKGGLDSFIQYFNQVSSGKSEFMLYAAWLEKNGGIVKYHQITHNYGHPMLRDSRTDFDKNYWNFLLAIGQHPTHAWVSANHRSWGDMTDEQYQLLCRKLSNYGLVPKFNEYRATYVDYKF